MKRPTQQRGRETFARILDAAAKILADKGIRGLNTNLVAEMAGVTPPTIYRYFSDKVDILKGLSERFIEQEVAWLSEAQTSLGLQFSPSSWVDTVVSGYWKHAARFVGLPELRQAMKTYEALAEYEEQSLSNSTASVQQVLSDHVGYPDPDAGIAARFLIETTCSTVDRCYGLSAFESKQRLEQLKKMLTLYISSY